MVIQIARLSKKQIKSLGMDDTIAFATYDPIENKHTITIPYRTSTKTRLHEIAHCKLGHCLSPKTTMLISEYIAQEVGAEEWAYQKCGKTLSIEVVLNIAHQAIMFKARSNFVFSSLLQTLTKYNYKLTQKQRAYLWHTCKEYETERRGIIR